MAVLAAAFMGPSFAPAQAADLQVAPVFTKAAPLVDDWSPWAIRVRAADVLSSSNGKSTLYNNENPAMDSPVSSLAMSSAVIPVIDVSYYFTRNLAVELDLGWPPRSTITGTGALDGLTIGKASALPPVLMFQYHFTGLGHFQPYVGLGVNYTTFFNVKAANSPTALPTAPVPVAVSDLRIKDSVGAVAQIGFDYMIDRHWGINVDAKKVWMRPGYAATADFINPANGDVIQQQSISGAAHIDPWILGGGVVYKF